MHLVKLFNILEVSAIKYFFRGKILVGQGRVSYEVVLKDDIRKDVKLLFVHQVAGKEEHPKDDQEKFGVVSVVKLDHPKGCRVLHYILILSSLYRTVCLLDLIFVLSPVPVLAF